MKDSANIPKGRQDHCPLLLLTCNAEVIGQKSAPPSGPLDLGALPIQGVKGESRSQCPQMPPRCPAGALQMPRRCPAGTLQMPRRCPSGAPQVPPFFLFPPSPLHSLIKRSICSVAERKCTFNNPVLPPSPFIYLFPILRGTAVN